MVNAQIERLRNAWNRLSMNQRVAVIAVLITAVMALGLLIATRPPQRYGIAFSGLSGEDAAAIVENLRAKGIPYELSSDGGTIRVPADQVAAVRLDAASQGLPRGGSDGFELFDKSSLGLTDFTQRVNYQRAIEGELERTIAKIDAVEAARVHIVIPEESLFTDEQQPTTAAVVLKLKSGRQLTDAQIRGITHLVSGAVPNLKPENLTVIDNAGNPIWAGPDGGSQFSGLDERFRLQQAYEQNLERQLQALVNPIAGPGHAVVRVSATLNWDERNSQSEIYSPDGQQPQVRSQQEREQRTSGTVTETGGVPGVDENVQTYPETPGTGNQSESSSREVTTNYELSRRVEQVVQAPGQVQRLSVAVMLDGSQVDPAVAQEIQDVISAAAGLVPQRGDTITVTAVPFSDLGNQNLIPDGGTPILEYALTALKVLGLIAIPLVALFFARRILVKPDDAGELTPALATAGGPALAEPPMPAFATQRISISETSPALEDEDQSQSTDRGLPQLPAHLQVIELANTDPGQVAQLLRAWMSEEQ
ncbi:flagellar basal-body MS-ring/collar protein FliF [Sphaerobacter sp.]|uniref:flagellar basal-body MS-ring/collar protein FliF n=1 Tax=Sphaerobacter sp. TaxID=2099654 RepID=UPI001E0DCDCF|nr:flagellar basal-body MS-ring/collar protein FliF [Sphaerobacter sp.]MBX5446026.1 flagellar M-ring protein FliF [Sphaerobacter sp.]